MILSNYHLHSVYCDGDDHIRDYVEKAVQLGFHSIGLSSHSPTPVTKGYGLPIENFSAYLDELAVLKQEFEGTIEVYAGLELDYHPDFVSFFEEHFFSAQLDYLIGSVHSIGHRPDGTPWFFERKSKFDEGLYGWYQGDIQAVMRDHYQSVRNMVSLGKIDFIGHMDRIKRHCINVDGFDESASWYQEEVEQTLECIAKHGVMLEINLGGLRHPIQTPYPSPWVLKRCHELDIGLTVNTDGHQLSHLDLGFPQALGFLKDAGYTEIFRLQQGQWMPVTLELSKAI